MTLSAQRPSDRPAAPKRTFAHKALFTAVAAATAVLALASGARAAESVEVIHWWTSGGETAAVGGADTFAFTQINNTRDGLSGSAQCNCASSMRCFVAIHSVDKS